MMINEMITKEDAAKAISILTEFVLGKEDASDAESNSLFCDPPGSTDYIYVDDKSGRYYFHLKGQPEGQDRDYCSLKGLRCQITGVKLFDKESDEGVSQKVHLSIVALDNKKPYILEKTVNTNFGRGLLLALEQAGVAIKSPVIIEVSVPEQRTKKTCFCNLHTLEGRVDVKDKSVFQKDNQEYLGKLINKINENLK